MKNKILISSVILLILITACKKNGGITNFTITEKDTLNLNNEKGFSKNNFKDRAEELIYIREYLKYKLPKIMIDEDIEYVKKAQYSLISDGENPTLEEAASRTIKYSNKYEAYMNLIIMDKLSFMVVKRQLESNGDLNFKTIETNSSILKNENDTLNAVNSISRNPFPEYLIDLNQYSPNVSGVCEDQGYSDCFRDATAIVKELAKIRKEHLNNRYNGDYLKFYETEKAVIENRSWEKDASNIDNYIVGNIERYNDALKECGYDDFDWFKKLPKDLYKYFDLNKTELLKNIK